jgi:hypothetical protein
MSVFEKGRAKTGGRAQGVRNKLGTAFLEALSKHFNEVGHKAIEIVFQERPVEYVKIIAATLPREFEITTNSVLAELPDEELELVIQYVTRLVGGGLADRLEASEEREDETARREQVRILSTVS